ncbi:MAG: hypothetical protein A2096_08740 [Spirochaetes bacterium GWF1_41_5]|nr:MAG: hypothetical protein A2096_08740 [Spirochaetes bacterium GWF1_41_5]
MLCRIIEKTGLKTLEPVINTAEALKSVNENRPSLVFTDINLQKKFDGITLAKLLHKKFDIPVVFSTGMDDAETVKSAMLAGPYGYIVKPFQEREIFITIQGALKRHAITRKYRDLGNEYKTLIKSIPDIVFRLNSRGQFEFLSESASSLGYQPAELIGKYFYNLISDPHDQEIIKNFMLHAQDELRHEKTGSQADKTRNLIVRLQPKKKTGSDNGITALVDAEGKYSIDANTMHKNFTGTHGKIYLIEKPDNNLFNAENRKIIFYELDNTGKIIYIDRSITLLGYSAEELIGRHFSILLCSDSLEQCSAELVLPAIKGVITGAEQSPKLFNERRSGSRSTRGLEIKIKSRMPGKFFIWAEINAGAYIAGAGNKKHYAVAGVIRDITERKNSENNLSKYTGMLEAELKQKQKQLIKAQKHQRAFIPERLPLFAGLHLDALYFPTDELGGDFFDIRKKNNFCAVILADCTGHGIEAALDSTLLKSVSDRCIDVLMENLDPAAFLTAVNSAYYKYTLEEQFPTMFACIIDSITGRIIYANANYELPVIRSSEKAIRLKRGAGFHIGYNLKTRYKNMECFLPPGANLLFFSDALSEIKISGAQQISFVSLLAAAEKADLSGNSGAVNFTREITRNLSATGLDDDCTVIVCSRLPEYSCRRILNSMPEYADFQEKTIQVLSGYGYGSEDISAIAIASSEMAANAFKHGCGGTASVEISCRADGEKFCITITDQGSGFDHAALSVTPAADFLSGDTENEELCKLGVWIARFYMDEVNYNAKGNSVVMHKYKTPAKTSFSLLPETSFNKKNLGITFSTDLPLHDIINRSQGPINLEIAPDYLLSAGEVLKIFQAAIMCSKKNISLHLLIKNNKVKKILEPLELTRFGCVIN